MKLNRILISSILLIFIQTSVLAQINLSFYSHYVFADKFDSYYDPRNYYNGTIEDDYQWGVGIEYQMDIVGVELMYLRMTTIAPTTYANNDLMVDFTVFDMDINYIMVGGVKHFESANGVLEGFGGIMGGLAVAGIRNPDNGREDSVTKLAWGARLGGIVWPTDMIGLKVQAQLLSAVQSVGGSFYFGTGGSGAGLSGYSTIFQFGLGGGLVIRINPAGR